MDILKMLRRYFSQNLGDFYSHTANRLILYPLIFSFFLVEGAAIWLLYRGPAFYLDHMAFTTVYSLHKAAGNTICLWMADVLAHYLNPAWGAFNRRTIGRQWLIWSFGLAVGFIPLRATVRSLVAFYAPDVAAYYQAHPEANLSIPTLLLILIPFWCVAMVLTLKAALAKQRIQQLAEAIQVIHANPVVQVGLPSRDATNRPATYLKLDGGNGRGPIALADISHISVEDHYCRINYVTGNGLKNEMIRLPLKKLMLKLPRTLFVQIHRSHVVNIGRISRLTRKDRDHRVVLTDFDVELPVSRSRFKDLKNRM